MRGAPPVRTSNAPPERLPQREPVRTPRGELRPSWKLSGGQFQVATGGAQSSAGRAAARHAPRETPTSADRRRTRLRAQVSDRPALTFIFSQISPPEAPRTPQAPRPPALHPRRTASTRALYPRVPYSTASRHRARADIPPPNRRTGPQRPPLHRVQGIRPDAGKPAPSLRLPGDFKPSWRRRHLSRSLPQRLVRQ